MVAFGSLVGDDSVVRLCTALSRFAFFEKGVVSGVMGKYAKRASATVSIATVKLLTHMFYSGFEVYKVAEVPLC